MSYFAICFCVWLFNRKMSALNKTKISLNYLTKLNATNVARKCSNAVATKEEGEVDRPVFLDDDAEGRVVKRDRSGLLPQHRNRLHGNVPYAEPHSWIHLTENYQRKMFGRYGSKSGVDPRICYPAKDDLKSLNEYNQLAEPYTLAEMMAQAKLEKQEKIEAIQKREEDIAKKLDKLEQWKTELNAKIAKKEADTLAAKKRKERLIEEVRRHFGFKVDPRDERFKEMLEQKEKEDKKKQKEAKRKLKEEKMMAKLLEKNPAGKEAKTKKASSKGAEEEDKE